MILVNLIPAGRREAARRRAHLRAWGALTGVATAIVLGGLVVAHASRLSGNQHLVRRRADLTALAHKEQREVQQLEEDVNAAAAQVRAHEAVGRRADWSVLLGLLADLKGEEVVLRRCALAAGARGRVPRAEPAQGSLDVEGFGRTQPAVSAFVLQLEQTGLFRFVKLVETRREPLGTGQVVAFRVQCVFE